MDGIAMKKKILSELLKDTHGLKSNEGIITKFEWKGFQFIKSTEEINDGSGITPSYFSALMNIAFFWSFYTIQSQGIEQTI